MKRSRLSPQRKQIKIEQRKFVLWWDKQEKQQGAHGVGKKVALQTSNATLKDLSLDGVTVHRWRARLKDEKNSRPSH